MTTRPRRSPVVGVQQERSRAWIRILVLALLLATIAAPAYGYYRVTSSRAMSGRARIGGEAVLTRGDVAERMQTVARLNQTSGDANSLGGNPYEVLRSMVEDELIRRAAARGRRAGNGKRRGHGAARSLPSGRFRGGRSEPGAVGERVPRGLRQIPDARQAVRRGVPEPGRVQLYREVLRQELATRIPLEAEQVEIAWIVLPRDFEELNAVFGL